MIRFISSLSLLLLTACGGGGDRTVPPPISGVITRVPIVMTMNVANWAMQCLAGCPQIPAISQEPSGIGIGFDFPPQNGAHYLVMPTNGKISGTPTLTFTLAPEAKLIDASAADCGGSNNPTVTFYFQRIGDTLAGVGPYQYYRYWARSSALNPGTYTVQAPMDPSVWTDVQGQSATVNPQGFADAAANVQAIGVTFGGCNFGHGVYGSGHFTLNSYEIN